MSDPWEAFSDAMTESDKRELRDRFAMAAITGLLADPTSIPSAGHENWTTRAADSAYRIADAMLERRTR